MPTEEDLSDNDEKQNTLSVHNLMGDGVGIRHQVKKGRPLSHV